MENTVKKRKALKITIITIVSIIVLMIIFSTVCVVLAVQDPYKEKYSTTDTVTIDADLVADVARAAVFGKEYIADDQEINSYIRKGIESRENSNLKDFAIYFHENNKSEIYGRFNMDIPFLNYNGNFGMFCETEFSLNQDKKALEVKLSNAKLGMLPIPDSILEKILSDTLKDTFEYKNTTIYFPIALETTVEGININVSLEEFIPKEGKVSLKSNKILADALDSATDRAKKWIKENESSLSEYGDDIVEWIDNNKDKLDKYESQAEDWVDNNKNTISEYGNKLEQWASENSETVSEYTDKAKKWIEEHIN